MKNLLFTGMIWLICHTTFGQNQAVEQVVVRFFDALSVADSRGMRAEVTKDFMLLENGEFWTMDTLEARISKPKPEGYLRTNAFDFRQTTIRKNMAWTYYWNRATIQNKGQTRTVQWLESAILVRRKGIWKMILMHSTPKK